MIKLNNITKTYKDIKAVEDINLHIKEGELVILKGQSGSGKSTILSLIAALSKPTSGEVIVDEKRVSKLPDDFASLFRRDSIGFIFQKYNLIPNLSVKDNILTPLLPSNPPESEAREKLQSVMKKFDISHKENEIVKNLSGGEQQRVAIARSMINSPKIIIADEPTANLDAKLSLEFIKILEELKNMGKTIVVATHDPLFFDLDFIDKVVEMKNGKIIS